VLVINEKKELVLMR